MQKRVYVLIWLLFVLMVIFPMGKLAGSRFGYSFELISTSAFAITIALLSLCIVVLIIRFKVTIQDGLTRILLILNTPLSLISAVCYIAAAPNAWTAASMAASVAGCVYLTVKIQKRTVLKIITVVLSIIIGLHIGFVGLVAMLVDGFGQYIVVQTVESPNGKYYAQVIDSDQGSLGGNTFVDVYEKKAINLILFKFQKKPERVYNGNWGEYADMKIYWKDDNCLIINSAEYNVK